MQTFIWPRKASHKNIFSGSGRCSIEAFVYCIIDSMKSFNAIFQAHSIACFSFCTYEYEYDININIYIQYRSISIVRCYLNIKMFYRSFKSRCQTRERHFFPHPLPNVNTPVKRRSSYFQSRKYIIKFAVACGSKQNGFVDCQINKFVCNQDD